jgi:hypothetical protein
MIHTRKNKDEQTDEKEKTKSNWMENKLGMVFSSEHFVRWTDSKGQKQHRIGKREYITYLGPAEEFKKHLFATALRNGYGGFRKTILLSDGATWIRNMKDELYPDAQQILDFFHLSEHIAEFSKAVFNNDESKYEPWTKEMCALLKASQYKEVLKTIDKLGRKCIQKSSFDLSSYIINNKNNIDYAQYLANDWYIGSGAIESGNKTVLQQRLKQAGMRWNLNSGQYILSLMSKVKSNQWIQDVVRACKKIT